MPEEVGDQSDVSWLLEPPAPGKVHLFIAIGSDVDLTPEARDAIETLISGIEDAEVSGFMLDVKTCPGQKHCAPYGKCHSLWKTPNCVMFTSCQISR